MVVNWWIVAFLPSGSNRNCKREKGKEEIKVSQGAYSNRQNRYNGIPGWRK